MLCSVGLQMSTFSCCFGVAFHLPDGIWYPQLFLIYGTWTCFKLPALVTHSLPCPISVLGWILAHVSPPLLSSLDSPCCPVGNVVVGSQHIHQMDSRRARSPGSADKPGCDFGQDFVTRTLVYFRSSGQKCEALLDAHSWWLLAASPSQEPSLHFLPQTGGVITLNHNENFHQTQSLRTPLATNLPSQGLQYAYTVFWWLQWTPRDIQYVNLNTERGLGWFWTAKLGNHWKSSEHEHILQYDSKKGLQ